MAKRRSSACLLESDEETSSLASPEKGNQIGFVSDNFSSEGDDVEKFNEHVRLFDSKLCNTEKAVKIDNNNSMGTGGTIQCIELFNFMCHDHLKVELKDNINFIVGNNGSGKSAILTALTVCLGARASSTQRANSLESLIKEGALQATIVVTISNSGALKFKGDLYGESIIVERRFKRNGPNTFKTMSIDHRRVSDKKDEVISICDNYNIQVDNPLSVLTQETAKKFLVNSTPQDLYEFFMRATQLEQLSFDYAYALDRMKSMQTSLNAAKRSWPSLEEQVENLRTQLITISEQKEMVQKKEKLRAEIIWADIECREKEIQIKELQIASENNQINSNNDMLEVLKQKLAETNESLKTSDAEITSLYNSKRPLNEELSRLGNNLSGIKIELNHNESVQREINTEVTKAKKELSKLEAKIGECAKTTDLTKLKKDAEVSQFEQEILENNFKISEAENQIKKNLDELECLEKSLERAQKIFNNDQETSLELNNDLDKAKLASKEKIRFFGENITEVVKQIKLKIKDFVCEPVGPIGMFVELADPTWSIPMDAIIGSHLRSFITHDHRDRKLLEHILKTFKCNNPIINLSPEPIDTRNGEPDQKFLTALRVLKISNESVKKALIMFANIEKILLISDRVEAREVMKAHLRNVDAAYTLTHRVTTTQNSLAFFAIYSNNKGNPFTSDEERIRCLSKQIKEISHQLKIACRDIDDIKRSIEHHRKIEIDLKENVTDLKRRSVMIKTKIRNIEDFLGENDHTGIDFFLNEKKTTSNHLASLKNQFGATVEIHIELSEKVDEINEQIETKRNEFNMLEREIDSKKTLITSLNFEKRQVQNELERHQESNLQLNKNVIAYNNSLNVLRAENIDLIQKASLICQRIYTKRSTTSIEKEIHKLEQLIEKSKDFSFDDYENVKFEYEEKLSEFEKSKINVRINENILDDMKIALEKRQRQWEDLRSGIAKRSNQDFSACLQARDYRGYLDYDHKNRELHINVHIDQIEQNSSKNHNLELSKRDIKQLSGGEKSFGTTCFLLSLWDAMGCPIRCLDEFDVYMDAVNRRLVVEMLVNNAKNSGTQFILITPVTVRNFLDSDDQGSVHMVVLRDPKRNN